MIILSSLLGLNAARAAGPDVNDPHWGCYDPLPGYATDTEKTAFITAMAPAATAAEQSGGPPATGLLAGYEFPRIRLWLDPDWYPNVNMDRITNRLLATTCNNIRNSRQFSEAEKSDKFDVILPAVVQAQARASGPVSSPPGASGAVTLLPNDHLNLQMRGAPANTIYLQTRGAPVNTTTFEVRTQSPVMPPPGRH
jgi:hypothetical protein